RPSRAFRAADYPRSRGEAALTLRYILFLAAALLAPRALWAIDAFEIQVYDDRMNKPGQLSAELHANVTAQGRRDPAFPGEIPPHRMARLTLEPAYGMTPYWELGAY